MKLVIAEKPSVAMSLAAVLGANEKKDGYLEGGGYLVSWCVGHLLELAQPEAYGEQYARWRYGDLPILPETWKYEVPKDKKKQLDLLCRLMKDKRVDSVVCATDAGREGELIFRLVYEHAGCKKPMERLWISSMEDAAIRDGFEHLRPGSDYDKLYNAAVCRAGADWLIGINATRLFSVLYAATSFQLPNGELQEMAREYATGGNEVLKKISSEIFHFYLKDPYASQFRKMLSIEKYKNEEIDRIYREVYIDTAISYQAKLFEEMIKQGFMRQANPEVMALQFFSPIFLLLNKYDGIAEKEKEAKEILGKHIEQFDMIYRKEAI